MDIVKSATMVGPGEEKINRTEEERMDKPGSFHWRTGDWQLVRGNWNIFEIQIAVKTFQKKTVKAEHNENKI